MDCVKQRACSSDAGHRGTARQRPCPSLAVRRLWGTAHSAVQIAEQCQDDLAFLNVALGFERKTLNLVNEMGSLVPEANKDVVDDITCEEQSHLVALLEARDKIKG